MSKIYCDKNQVNRGWPRLKKVVLSQGDVMQSNAALWRTPGQAARSTLFSVISSIFSLLGMRSNPSTQPFLANHWPLRKLPAVRLEFGLRAYFHSCNSRSGYVERLPFLHGGMRLVFSFLQEIGGQSRSRTFFLKTLGFMLDRQHFKMMQFCLCLPTILLFPLWNTIVWKMCSLSVQWKSVRSNVVCSPLICKI